MNFDVRSSKFGFVCALINSRVDLTPRKLWQKVWKDLAPLPSVQSEYRGNHAILEQYNFLHHPTENEDKMRTETLSFFFAILVIIKASDLT